MAGRHPAWYIAEAMGVSVNTVITCARRHGVSLAHQKRQWSECDNARLVNYVSEGLTQRRIGELTGRTTGAVRLQVAKLRKEGLID